ncbi:MAG TPA: hypothetical protein VLT81_08375 [Chondromyces sp.]|nr:hypothetical protein [Chondromyces sp.]
MGAQRELNALLFELQAAASPLERAKILARAWRTVRGLNAVDRRLLVRHAGFEGAEQIVEGLVARRGGVAPALLLRTLGNARSSDGAALGELLQSIRDPGRRAGLADQGVRVAEELLREPVPDPPRETINEAERESRDIDEIAAAAEEEALAALHAIDRSGEVDGPREGKAAEPPSTDETAPRNIVRPAPAPGLARGPGGAGSPPRAPEAASIEPGPALPRHSAAPGWRTLSEPSASPPASPAEAAAEEGSRLTGDAASFDAAKVLSALGADDSVVSRLLVLHRELDAFRGSSTGTLRELLLSFPDGWPRRRALMSLIRGGVIVGPDGAVELAATLEREPDRRWCLGLVAAGTALKGPALQRALELVDSTWAKRRLAGG